MSEMMLSESVYQFLSLDVPPILTALFSSLSCALLGNFLLLRRMSLMGDAISHAVLPGIVAAFLITHTRESLWIFAGAALAGLFSSILIEVVKRAGRMDSGAAMGVVFSLFFASGVVMMEQAAARSVDLDAECLLYGQLESIFWFPPHSLSNLMRLSTFSLLPMEVWISLVIAIFSAGIVYLFFKELTISSFDPALGTSLGFSSSLLHFGLMVVVAAAVVSAFSAVGSILVIAMVICPAATARMLTDRLRTQILLSLLVASIASIGGYVLGAFGPPLLGWPQSVNTAGSIAVVIGFLLALAIIFSPNYGLIARRLRNWRLSIQVLREDILGFLYRSEELRKGEQNFGIQINELPEPLIHSLRARLALRELLTEGFVFQGSDGLSMTSKGRGSAMKLVRTHRLWESYLAQRLGLPPDHIHKSASQLEHFTGDELASKLAEVQSNPTMDPHGMPIPSKENEE